MENLKLKIKGMLCIYKIKKKDDCHEDSVKHISQNLLINSYSSLSNADL